MTTTTTDEAAPLERVLAGSERLARTIRTHRPTDLERTMAEDRVRLLGDASERRGTDVFLRRRCARAAQELRWALADTRPSAVA